MQQTSALLADLGGREECGGVSAKVSDGSQGLLKLFSGALIYSKDRTEQIVCPLKMDSSHTANGNVK